MKVNLRRSFLHPILLLRTLSPFSLAHHPSCEQYSGHCVEVRGHRLCIGCFIGFPATFIALAAIILATYFGILRLTFINTLLLGVGIEGILFIGKAIRHARKVSARVATKIAQATGIAFLLYAPISMPWSIAAKIIAVLMIWMTINSLMSAQRMYETGKTCEACKYKARWSRCPGFRDVVKKLLDGGFLTQ